MFNWTAQYVAKYGARGFWLELIRGNNTPPKVFYRFQPSGPSGPEPLLLANYSLPSRLYDGRFPDKIRAELTKFSAVD